LVLAELSKIKRKIVARRDDQEPRIKWGNLKYRNLIVGLSTERENFFLEKIPPFALTQIRGFSLAFRVSAQASHTTAIRTTNF